MEISTDFIIATSPIWVILLLGVFVVWFKHKYRQGNK
jgi:hypothetical protein